MDLLFKLDYNFKFQPQVVAHFSHDDLIGYLEEYLKSSSSDGIKRVLEVFDDRNPKPWKTFTEANELKSVDRTIRQPVILDRAFFNDIYLHIVTNEKSNVVASSMVKLKSVIGHFINIELPRVNLFVPKTNCF